ncbi:MAG: NADP-dependent oxidoreductase, partial [Proteobacteria bacterium]|nr:NADP-dependent oxidoreductase [Pseudomonadota bacterium]
MSSGITNRQWIMVRRPEGDDFESALEMRPDAPMPVPEEGQILIHPHYLSMDAGTRMWMTAREDSYQPPLPVGAPVNGMMIAEVIETRRPDFAVGDMLRCFGQWADYCCVDESAGLFQKLVLADDLPLPAHLAMGGPNGWTAIAGIRDVAEAKAGETVLISAAAGATGSLAALVAKNMGCRVIGLTSRDDKCKWLTDVA